MEDISQECISIVNEVCEKYNYDRNDTEGNDSLRTVLLKVVPAMLKKSPKEDRELFYQMLRHTPIVVTEKLTQEGYDKLVEQYIGDVNPHIKEEQQDLGEYSKDIGAGAYVSAPIIDENMQLKGKKSFLYVQKVLPKAKEFLGTDINVSHLIHELGHAWHAEKDQYIMSDEGKLIERVGAATFTYSYTKESNGEVTQKCDEVTGLFIEEGMNTISEEEAMANYMGISREEMKKAYSGNGLVKSNYQGLITDSVEHLMQKTFEQDFENWRLYANQSSKNKIESLLEKTELWEKREKLDSLDNKRDVLSNIDRTYVKEFFEKYENVYFPDASAMAPFDKVDNVLEQIYDLSNIKYQMGIESYSEFTKQILYEIYPFANQAAQVKAKQEVLQNVEDIEASAVDDVTNETRDAVNQLRTEEKEIQGESRDE